MGRTVREGPRESRSRDVVPGKTHAHRFVELLGEAGALRTIQKAGTRKWTG